MKKIFLTSAICMAFACPAMADIAANASGATCNTDTLGTGSGSATLEAKWEANTYICNGGQYLRGSDATYQTCPANYICNCEDSATYDAPSGDFLYTYDGTDLGLVACPSEYPYSAQGNTTYYNCYDIGTIACSTHNPYRWGHGTATYANATASYKTYLSLEDKSKYYDLDEPSACNIASLSCDTGYTSGSGPLSGYVSSTPTTKKYKSISGTGENSTNTTGLNNGEWELTYSDGTVVHGIAKCADKSSSGEQDYSGEYYQNRSFEEWSATETQITSAGSGDNCWCAMSGYNLQSGSLQTVNSSSRVYFSTDRGPVESPGYSCADECAMTCAETFVGARNLWGAAGAQMACIANTISLDWDPLNGQAHTTNSCTYDGAITIPAAPEKVGYTFNGWKLK